MTADDVRKLAEKEFRNPYTEMQVIDVLRICADVVEAAGCHDCQAASTTLAETLTTMEALKP